MQNGHVQRTLLDYVDRNAARNSGGVAAVDGEITLTWSEYRRKAQAVALLLLDLGVALDDVVGLHMVNRVEHALSDMGALLAGAIPSSFYNTLSEDQLAYVARDSAASVVIADAEHLAHWLNIWDELPALRYVLVLDLDRDEPTPPGVLRFETWVESAEAQLDIRVNEIDRIRAQVQPSDPLTIVYTSGTTGPPKGTVITHAAAVYLMVEVNRQLAEHLGGPVPVGWSTVSYLPLAHIAERLFSHYQSLHFSLTVHYVRDATQLPHVLGIARPYFFLGVPRVWERMHAAIRERAATSRSPLRRRLILTAMKVARQVGAARLSGTTPKRPARTLYPVMERLVYRKIRSTLGLDRVTLAASGAAQLPPEICAFFAGVGIDVIEVYGMTETCAMLAASPLDAPRLGSVGKALGGIDLKIATDGEVLASGPNITPGYINRPEATAEAIDAAGWLHTGDIGFLDADGYLTITGRKKDLINTASGKTLSPANVEMALGQGSELIGSVYVHGDDKPCLVALVTLDPTAWRGWCQARGIDVDSLSEAVNNGRVRLDVARSIGAGNATLSRAEQVKNWTLLDESWSVHTGELTPTLKLKRNMIAVRYLDEIEQLYDPLTSESWTD